MVIFRYSDQGCRVIKSMIIQSLQCIGLQTYHWVMLTFFKFLWTVSTLCFLRACKACLMVSYSSPCSVSVMDRQDESIFNLSSFIAAERKEFHSQGKDRACLAWGLCWSAGPKRGFGLGLGAWGLELRNLEKSREINKVLWFPGIITSCKRC